MTRVLVLLKNGELEAVACERKDVFTVARSRHAGICGVFDDHTSAETYIKRIRSAQDHWSLEGMAPKSKSDGTQHPGA